MTAKSAADGAREAVRRFGTRANVPAGVDLTAAPAPAVRAAADPGQPTSDDYRLLEAEHADAGQPAHQQPRRPRPDRTQGSGRSSTPSYGRGGAQSAEDGRQAAIERFGANAVARALAPYGGDSPDDAA